ncbi:MAG: glycosyl transferase family 2, partial [Candidatus Aenigmarchaeota archaeon ex4484_52]
MNIQKPLLSIIIPTLNEEKYIPLLLNSIKKQTYKNYEIIVCDSHSKDKCYSIDKKGPGHGRNIGAKYAKGRYLLFFDSDTIIPDKFFLFKFFRQVNK